MVFEFKTSRLEAAGLGIWDNLDNDICFGGFCLVDRLAKNANSQAALDLEHLIYR
jgi:hypothetical protein